MRTLIIGFVVFLAACNSSTTQVPYSDPALVAKVDSLTKALAAATHNQAEQFKKVQLEGPTGINHSSRDTFAISNGIDFGPCTDAGIKIGGTVKDGASALDEQTQAFKQTPTQTCPGVYAEYDVATGNLHTAPRVYFTSPDCTGNPLVWDAGGNGYDPQKLPAGLSFISPVDGRQYWVAPNTTPVMTQVQSVYIVINGACAPDGDNQPMWEAIETNTSISGVPLTLGIGYQISGL